MFPIEGALARLRTGYIPFMSPSPTVLAVCRGTVLELESREGPWRSAIHKDPVEGPVHVGPRGIEGDCCADTRHHGSPDQAVLLYTRSHYGAWREELTDVAAEKFDAGGFGENLSVEGLDEASVRVGDRLRFGTLELEVTMPRVPCFKLNRKFGTDLLLDRVRATGRTGFYARVLAEGTVEAPATIEWSPIADHEWTIARVNQVFQNGGTVDELSSLSDVASLGGMMKSWVAQRLETGA